MRQPVGIRVALRDVRGERALEKRAEGPRQIGSALMNRHDAAGGEAPKELSRMGAGKRQLAGQRLVRDRREGPQVATVIDARRAELLGAHVTGRTVEHPRRGGEGSMYAERAGDAEIQKLDE